MPGGSALMRLLLLAVLAFGVTSMHTLGHEGPAGHFGPAPAGHGAMAVAMERTAAASPFPGVVDRTPGPGRQVHPFAVCLAILSVAVLVLLSVLLAGGGRRAPVLRSGPMVTTGTAGRGPPRGTPIGLALARVSVMRT